MLLSVRSTLSAGIAAGLVVAAGATAVSPAIERPLHAVSSQAFQLSAAIEPLLQPVVPAAASGTPAGPTANLGTGTQAAGDWIITVYDYVQPWVQYGVNLAAWAVGWLPWPVGLIGPELNILYSGWQPIGESLAYAASFLLNGQFDQILPTLAYGVKTGVGNLVRGQINWLLSFFPPLPPIPFPVPPRPGAALTARLAAATQRSAAIAATAAGVEAPAAETPAADAQAGDAQAGDAPAADAQAADAPAADAPVSEPAPTRRAALREQRKEARAAARAARSAAASAPKVRKAERVAARKAAATGARAARATR